MSSRTPAWTRRVRQILKRLLDLAGRHAFTVGAVVSFSWNAGLSAYRGDWREALYEVCIAVLGIALIRSRGRCYHLQKTNDELLGLLRYGREAALQRGILRPATISRLIRHAARVLDNNSPKGPAK